MHAEARLPRCAKEAAPLLVAALGSAKGPAFASLASTLAAIAPAEAVRAFVPLFDERAVERRQALRTALGRAAKLPADKDGRVRGAAARAVVDARSFQAELVRALEDPEMRVRAEAARSLAGAPDGPATPALLARLEKDPWPLVRAASAASLGGAPRGGDPDRALASALEDEGWLVRREALGALGKRGARAHTEAVIERLEDKEERFDVRVAAARALGLLCDPAAVGPLSKQLAPLADPYGSLESRGIAVAALAALRDIGPRDFKDRISVLYAKGAPPVARAAAEAALSAPSRGRCGR
jgi:HEAT repeat protein